MKDKIIFIDSDGTVMDSMTPKHETSFGPALIDTFKLHEFSTEILKEWDRINLYSLSRGINRFDGLYMCLSFVNNKYKKIDILDAYKKWLDKTTSKSNGALEEYIKNTNSIELQIVLDWSNETNRRIVANAHLVHPFDNVKEGFKKLHNDFKIMIVSSANGKAVREEWTKFGLIDYCDEVLTQEMGTKEACIKAMLEKYKPSFAVMLGDSPHDYNAAMHNNISFYPITPRSEATSWLNIIEKYADMFKDESYKKVEADVYNSFLEALK